MARRIILLGIDGLVLPLVEHFARQGGLPNFSRLFQEGALAKALPFVSTWGPINWMCFATGASPGTAWQGRVEVALEPDPATTHRGAYAAETLWQALERSGMRSVVVAYPGCWPPSIRSGYVAIPDPSGTNLPRAELAPPARYMTRGLAEKHRQPPGTRAGWIPLAQRSLARCDPLPLSPLGSPVGWRNLPQGPALATSFPLRGARGQSLGELGLLLQGAVTRSPEVLVCEGKDAAQRLGRLRPGKWSEWVFRRFGPDRIEGSIRFKLLEVAEGGREVALCHSQVYPCVGHTYPQGIEEGLLAAAGPYASGSSASLRPSDPFWQTAIQEASYEGEWLVAAAEHFAALDDWSLFMTVFRPVDAANHGCLAFVDPQSSHYGGKEGTRATEILRQAYGVADRILGGFMGMADGDTVVAVAADHGAVVNQVTCDIYRLLVQNGLLALDERDGRLEVNWSRTKAYIRPSRSGSEVYVNLASREPHGTVARAEYEALQERIIDLLLDWREPETGRRAIALALKKVDSALLGYWGEAAGDVQFIHNSGFVWGELPEGQTIARASAPSVNHGPQIPTTETRLTTNMGMFALWGQGVRRGYRHPDSLWGPVRMCDPAPTIAYLLGCDPPLQSEGAILRSMLS